MNNKDVNKLKSAVHYSGGPNHDQYVHYELENELGSKLEVYKQENTIYLSLLSKTEDILSTVNFTVGSGTGGSGLVSVSLDHDNKRMIFLSSDGQAVQCDLTKLYVSKQDVIPDLNTIRINAISGKEAKELLERKEAIWDAKSTVLVSDTGTSINEVNYITIDNVEFKITVDKNEFQEKLIAGENIIIDGRTISAKSTEYTAGKGIDISDRNVISVKDEYKNYENLDNKPSINGVTLLGAILGKDLKLDIVDYMLYRDYLNLEKKERKLYFICKNSKDIQAENCWRIYLQNKLIGEWDIDSGMVTLPKFPFRFPFRFA